ncbi:MAG: choice-of-anchor D domain-containing protein [Deltaproteobacteria bacterium]|nr:choice-of-anchor D domain-containing protein [Deltaproteobacteria bacterium]MCB9789306.1 choice-of-anchor D domain-containing protein [Deltaproteobacteria bacterium]
MRFATSALAALALCGLGLLGCSDTSSEGVADTGTGEPDSALADASFATPDAAAGPDGDIAPDPGPGDLPGPDGADASSPADAPDAAAPDVADADAPSPDVSPPDPGAPELAVDPTQSTFPYIAPQAATLIKQFTLYNTGDAPLHITGLSTVGSADFSLALLPPLPKVLAPQKQTIVRVAFNEGDGADGALRIESNDPQRPVLEVPLSSYVKGTIDTPQPCAQLQPSALNFGQVARGKVATLQTTLTNCSTSTALTLTQVTRSSFLFFPLSSEFQITNLPGLPHAIAPGQSVVLDVAYAPLLAGPDSGYFLLHTDDPKEPQLQLDVSGLGVAPPLTEIGLHINLNWDTDATDVDMHLLWPGGSLWDCQTDCYFGNPQPDWGTKGDILDDPFLDVDDVDGFGPENINISEPKPGTYKFIIHYYDDTWDGSFPQASNATVQLLSYGTLVQSWGPTHLDHINRTWDVFTVEWPSLKVTTLGAMYSNAGGGFCFP